MSPTGGRRWWSGTTQGSALLGKCTLLQASRSSLYYEALGESPLNLELMRLIDEQFLETPYYGAGRWSGTFGGRATGRIGSGYGD